MHGVFNSTVFRSGAESDRVSRTYLEGAMAEKKVVLSDSEREQIRAMMAELTNDKPPYPSELMVHDGDSDEVIDEKLKAQARDPESPFSLFAAAVSRGVAENAENRRSRKMYFVGGGLLLIAIGAAIFLN